MIEIYTKRVVEWLNKYTESSQLNKYEQDIINYGFINSEDAKDTSWRVINYRHSPISA